MIETDITTVAGAKTLSPENLTLAEELFIVADGDRYFVYALLTTGVESVSDAAVRRPQKIKDARGKAMAGEQEG
jgi:hypothetical protein